MGIRTFSIRRKYFEFDLPSEIVNVRPYVCPGRNQLTTNSEFKEWARINVRDHWVLYERPLRVGEPYLGQWQGRRVVLSVRFRNVDDAMAYKLRWV